MFGWSAVFDLLNRLKKNGRLNAVLLLDWEKCVNQLSRSSLNPPDSSYTSSEDECLVLEWHSNNDKKTILRFFISGHTFGEFMITENQK